MARTRAHAAAEGDLDQPDQILAQRAARGDREAFEVLYQRHAAAARRAALAVNNDPHDAADAVSEAFARLLNALCSGRLDPTAPFRPYLLATTRNAAVDAMRRVGRVEPKEDAGNDQTSTLTSPPESLLNGADQDFVARAFRSLPERWRSVLWLTEVEEIPPRDVAGLLGLSPNGVAQLAVRARAGLRQRFLQAHLGNGPVLEGCRRTVSMLGAYVAGGLAPRDLATVDQHLAACLSCQQREEELRDLGPTLRRALLPGVGGATALRHLFGRLVHTVTDTARRLTNASVSASRAVVPLSAASAGLLAVGLTGASVVSTAAAPASRHAHPSGAATVLAAGASGSAAAAQSVDNLPPAAMVVVKARQVETAMRTAAAVAASKSPAASAAPSAASPAPTSSTGSGTGGAPQQSAGATVVPNVDPLLGPLATPADPGSVIGPVCSTVPAPPAPLPPVTVPPAPLPTDPVAVPPAPLPPVPSSPVDPSAPAVAPPTIDPSSVPSALRMARLLGIGDSQLAQVTAPVCPSTADSSAATAATLPAGTAASLAAVSAVDIAVRSAAAADGGGSDAGSATSGP